jgi:hypothetical protein
LTLIAFSKAPKNTQGFPLRQSLLKILDIDFRYRGEVEVQDGQVSKGFFQGHICDFESCKLKMNKILD